MVDALHIRAVREMMAEQKRRELAHSLINEARLLWMLLEFDNVFRNEPANRKEYVRKLRTLIAAAEEAFGERPSTPDEHSTGRAAETGASNTEAQSKP